MYADSDLMMHLVVVADVCGVGCGGQDIRVNLPFYLPVDDTQIPTGLLEGVGGTAFDLTSPTRLSAERLSMVRECGVTGFDHCFAIGDADAYAAHSGALIEHATVCIAVPYPIPYSP